MTVPLLLLTGARAAVRRGSSRRWLIGSARPASTAAPPARPDHRAAGRIWLGVSGRSPCGPAGTLRAQDGLGVPHGLIFRPVPGPGAGSTGTLRAGAAGQGRQGAAVRLTDDVQRLRLALRAVRTGLSGGRRR